MWIFYVKFHWILLEKFVWKGYKSIWIVYELDDNRHETVCKNEIVLKV